MKQFRRLGKGSQGTKPIDNEVFTLTDKLVNNVKMVQSLSYDDSIYKALDSLDVPHYEEPLYEKIALGYSLATKPVTSDLVISCSNTIKHLWEIQRDWRYKVKSGAQEAQVIQFITESPGIEESELKTKLLDFGMNFAETAISIDQLYKQRRIGIIHDNKDKKQRKRYLWPFH